MLLDSAGIDYHVVLAQNALQQCVAMADLQPELVCGLIKQTSRVHPAGHSPGHSLAGSGAAGGKWGGASGGGGGQVNRSALHKISKATKQTTHVSGAWPVRFSFVAR